MSTETGTGILLLHAHIRGRLYTLVGRSGLAELEVRGVDDNVVVRGGMPASCCTCTLNHSEYPPTSTMMLPTERDWDIIAHCTTTAKSQSDMIGIWAKCNMQTRENSVVYDNSIMIGRKYCRLCLPLIHESMIQKYISAQLACVLRSMPTKRITLYIGCDSQTWWHVCVHNNSRI